MAHNAPESYIQGGGRMNLNEFRNEPHIDWTNPDNRKRMLEALEKRKITCQKTYPIIVDGRGYITSEILSSYDPADKNRLVGVTFQPDKLLITCAEKSAEHAGQSWRKLPWEKRAEYLLKTAQIVREKKFEMAALLVYEISKTWDEALGEIEEAIDFLELYARAALKYGKDTTRQPYVQAECNLTRFRPRGTTAAISTWNFPFSLSVEKIAASLAAGCPVLFKPAEQAPIVGWHTTKYFLDAGISPELLAYLPGGKEVGNILITLPSVTQISFTGSEKVGRLIEKSALETSGKLGIKNSDLEMGGSNSLIICPSADLDEAMAGVIRSRFSFNGQKCSALQRLILVGSRDDQWIKNFISRISLGSLKIGHPENPENNLLTAVIDGAAHQRITERIQRISQKGIDTIEKADIPKGGWFARPVVFYNLPWEFYGHPDIQEEVFGPVLFILNASSLDRALEIANSTRYGLTAGIYTGSTGDIDYFLEKIQAGNVYINRPIVGAMVDRQPFGGIKCSGKGKKVGTKEHLKFYLNEMTISQNLLSRGLKTS